MTALLTLDQAKAHLRVETTDFDADISQNIEEASEICLTYIKRRGPFPTDAEPTPPDWTDADLPADIRAAVKIMLSMLFDDRNAGKSDNPSVAMGYMPPNVTALLHRHRDPALA